MSVVLQTERKHIGTRIFWGVLYLLLFIGAASMIYPFLMMVSGSFKSRIDAAEMDVVPRFFSDDQLLYQKYVEAKYGEDINLYNEVNNTTLSNFSQLETEVVSGNPEEQTWRNFLEQTEMPAGWYMVGFGPTLDGKIIQKNERAFRNYIRRSATATSTPFERSFRNRSRIGSSLSFAPSV